MATDWDEWNNFYGRLVGPIILPGMGGYLLTYLCMYICTYRAGELNTNKTRKNKNGNKLVKSRWHHDAGHNTHKLSVT